MMTNERELTNNERKIRHITVKVQQRNRLTLKARNLLQFVLSIESDIAYARARINALTYETQSICDALDMNCEDVKELIISVNDKLNEI